LAKPLWIGTPLVTRTIITHITKLQEPKGLFVAGQKYTYINAKFHKSIEGNIPNLHSCIKATALLPKPRFDPYCETSGFTSICAATEGTEVK